jgi:membrane protease YdiL (CAAX protease family)
METDTQKTTPERIDVYTFIALFVSLVVYPLIYCSGIMGEIITPIFTENSRTHWWYFWLANMVFHWIPFALIWLALRKNGESWQSIGLDWAWFAKHKLWLGLLVAVLAVASFVMPGVLYGQTLPVISDTIFMAPVSSFERLFIIFGAFTAALTEEVIFRGFALTRLKRVVKSPWLALPVSVVSFLFIHGMPRSVEALTSYTIAGLAFGVPFILMGLKRLEILILIHFLIDASMVFAP